MRIQGMQSTRHRVGPPLKQSQVALKTSESREGITAGSAMPTWTEPKEIQNKLSGFSGCSSQQREGQFWAFTCICSCLCPSSMGPVVSSEVSLLSQCKSSSRRDSDIHLQAPRDSELPAPMAQGEGKIFGNSGLFWFSAIPCAAPGGLLLVCATLGAATATSFCSMRKTALGRLGKHL